MWLQLTYLLAILLAVNGQNTTEKIAEDLTEDSDFKDLPESITVEDVLEGEFENTNNTDELFPNRIVGGQVIGIRVAPYQVGILAQGSLICGGAIISRRWVLTAAHCLEGLTRNQLSIRAGSNYHRRGGQVIGLSNAVYHGRYRQSGFAYDIALLQLATPLRYNARVQPVNLPRSAREPLPRLYAATGWGTVVDNGVSLNARLRGVVLNAISLQRCRNIYRRIGIPVNRRTLCTYTPNRDTCQGDSGGPLVANFVIYGITSYGNGCARGIYPGVSTDVRYYLGWINRVLRTF